MANQYTHLTREQLIEECRKLYIAGGVSAVSYPALKKKGLYFPLYYRGVNQKALLAALGIEDAYQLERRKNWRRLIKGKVQVGWTWERVLAEAAEVVNEQGFIPPAEWFARHSKGSLVQAIYSLGKTFEDLRHHFSSFQNSDFVQSRNGMRWRSHPEASLSNFLYARKVEHKKGEKYPSRFAEVSQQTYGYYDLHFRDLNGAWIDVEVWGNKPKGHDELGYADKRRHKERFHRGKLSFLGIEFHDCFDDNRLTQVLKPYIGVIEASVFDKPHDEVIQSTHWSNADELISYCRTFVRDQPDKKFPPEDWLRKRGKWKDRPGPAYNTLTVYVKLWIGGIRNLRRILEQSENSTETWTRERAVAEYKKWFEMYGFVTGSIKKNALPNEERKRANRIEAAINKYAGGALEVQTLLGIKPFRPNTTRIGVLRAKLSPKSSE